MTLLGSIIRLYLTKENSSTRLKQNSLELLFGGIKTDKFLKKDEKREILISSQLSYEFAHSIDMPIQESDLGENILVNFDIKQLQIGDRLKVGNAIIEISLECPICKHLKKIDAKFPKLIKDERGIFAKVIEEGVITVEDNIYKI